MSAERTPPLSQPFPVDAAGRLAITSLNVPEVRPEEWRFAEGLSLGKGYTKAAISAGVEAEKVRGFVSNVLKRKFRGAGPFAVRLGIEMGQMAQPYNPDMRIELPAEEYRLLDLSSRGLTKMRLLRGSYGFTESAYERTSMELLEAFELEAFEVKDINHAVRRGFRMGVFPAVNSADARRHYENLLKLKRMRSFLHRAYPQYDLDLVEDSGISQAIENLGQAWGWLVLQGGLEIIREHPFKTAPLRQWLEGVNPAQMGAHHNEAFSAQTRWSASRGSLARAFGRYVSISLFIPESKL